MKCHEITVTPLAAESMGVRSLCTCVVTPSVSIVLDPSAALARRFGLEPHPTEYIALRDALDLIHQVSASADVLTVSHYHFDHVRPGATNWLYNFSSKDDLIEMYEGKTILAKDPRENINASQRRRGYFFQKDLKGHAEQIHVADGSEFSYGDTTITFSEPLPHGPEGSKLGYVLACLIEHDGAKVVYAPDVQGPVFGAALDFILSSRPDIAIVGGPPIYLDLFGSHNVAAAQSSLSEIAKSVETLVVDHHLMRIASWAEWLAPVVQVGESLGHRVMSMAELAGMENRCLEALRPKLYRESPPTDEFMKWADGRDEFKTSHPPPI